MSQHPKLCTTKWVEAEEALTEMLEEKQNLFHDLVMDAMEDITLSRAIQEGQKSGTAAKKQIFDILEGRA